MYQPAKKIYSPEEYLALEEKADYKSEYFKGEIFQMAGASINHNRITFNISGLLFTALEGKPCEAFAGDMRLLVQANGLYTYPDVMVICGQPEMAENNTSTVTNPIVIIEVLSETTAEYDRTDKFDLYKDLLTIQNYVLVEQDRPYVQCFQRGAETGWSVETYHHLEDNLILTALEIALPLKQVYNRVEWPFSYSRHPRSI